MFFDGEAYWLADGFHRYRAHERAACAFIAADVKQGTRRDAILYSWGANARHGLPRTNADKRRNVSAALADAEWSKRSDRWIAEKCGVSNNFVGVMRAEVSSDDTSDSPAAPQPTRTGADGKQYPAAPKKPPVVALVPLLAPRPDAAATAREIFDDLPAANESAPNPDDDVDEWDEIIEVNALVAMVKSMRANWPADISQRPLELALRYCADQIANQRKGAA